MSDFLSEKNIAQDPFIQFEKWFNEASNSNMIQPNAMALATVSKEGFPSLRFVLLKKVDYGFVFFTNYSSRKGKELNATHKASAAFYWDKLHRQVRIEGSVEQLSAAESDIYFNSRPRESQIGAWASKQSTILPDRSELQQRVQEITKRFEGKDVPRPSFWGGFRIIPFIIEFWQGRENRLSDRLRFRKEEDYWILERLSP